MLRQMSAELFEEWREFESIEPFGFPIEDLRGAVLASTVARSAGADLKAKDFLLVPPPPEEEVDDGGVSELEKVFGSPRRAASTSRGNL